MTGSGKITINNCPNHTLKEAFVVARVVAGEAWYYGNYPEDKALEVRRELGDNAIIVRVAK